MKDQLDSMVKIEICSTFQRNAIVPLSSLNLIPNNMENKRNEAIFSVFSFHLFIYFN